MTQARSYVLLVLLLTTGLLATTALFNEVTDPYGISSTFNRPGLNSNKPGQKGHDRLVKAYALRTRKADVVTLGTSRVQYGIDPNDEVLLAHGERPYNGALLGSNIYLALRYLQHAQAISPVRLAVLGLDPLMFDDGNQDATRDFSESRLAVSADGTPQPFATLTDLPSVWLSMDATRLSVRTWRKQNSIASDLTLGGQRSRQALARLFPEGSNMMERFISVDGQYAKDYRKALWPISKESSPSLLALQRLIAFATKHNIRLDIYWTPEHVHLHEVAKITGAKDAIGKLMEDVADVVLQAQAASAVGNQVSLWDFSTLNPITTEAVPGGDSQSAMQWFWEPTHTQDKVGHLILSRMLLPSGGKFLGAGVDTALLSALGEPLTPANVAEHKAAKDAALARWEASHPQDVARIEKACSTP